MNSKINRNSYDHMCTQKTGGYFVIMWTIDTQAAGSRLRTPKRMRRITDEAGAKRFCQKWNLQVPQASV